MTVSELMSALATKNPNAEVTFAVTHVDVTIVIKDPVLPTETTDVEPLVEGE